MAFFLLEIFRCLVVKSQGLDSNADPNTPKNHALCMVLFVPILLKYEVVMTLRFTVLNRCEGYRYSNTKGIRFSFHYKVSYLFAPLSPVHV
jgi:hypothetical protein